jgi:two-component system, LuxR family, response regulator FixJ
VTEKQPTVFIVDDDEAVRDSLKFLLESYDCRVEDYGTTRDFLRAFRPRERQCLVLDHHLPGETGLEFLESIDGASLRIPTIVLSGGGDRSLAERALKAGVVAYFHKPFDNDALLTTIFKAIGMTRAP